MANPFKALFSQKPACPYCKERLEKMPTRKTKCPFCGKYIYFKRTPELKIKKLVTEDEAKRIEQMWDARNQDIEKNEWIRRLRIDEKTFDNCAEELRNEIGKEPLIDDVVWHLSKKILTVISKSQPYDFAYAQEIYRIQASILDDANKDSFVQRQFAKVVELKHLKIDTTSLGLKYKVRIQTVGDDACEECRKLQGKTFTIDEALEKMPLPCPNCKTIFTYEKRGICRCIYDHIQE